ncbi:MAG: uridine kinase [Candidatus Weimeria sp.]
MNQPYETILSQVADWRNCHERGIIGIDGMCGSGKTLLAELIEERYGIPVFHTDDYYLPFSERKTDWRDICAGNMDLNRLQSEVLIPLHSGKPVQTFRYNCHEDIREVDERAASDFAVVEGTYSCHPMLRHYYTLMIFLTVPEQVQAERLKEREGDNYRNFVNTWIPMETHYFEMMHPERYADIVIKA